MLFDSPVIKFNYFIITLFLFVATCNILSANNTYFLPGDAFFYTRFDLESAKKLADYDSPILNY
ncbi:MAG: hypothetical protein AAGA30_02725, partial [Planctomycetota bacterium]